MTARATRAFRSLGLAACLAVSFASSVSVAAAGSSGAPQSAGQAEADPFRFTSQAAVVIWQIRADRTSDFEVAWRIIRDRALMSPQSELKSLGESLEVYRHTAPSGDAVTYIVQINPVVKARSYNPAYLLYESGLFVREEADELFKQMNETVAPGSTITPLPLDLAR